MLSFGRFGPVSKANSWPESVLPIRRSGCVLRAPVLTEVAGAGFHLPPQYVPSTDRGHVEPAARRRSGGQQRRQSITRACCLRRAAKRFHPEGH